MNMTEEDWKSYLLCPIRDSIPDDYESNTKYVTVISDSKVSAKVKKIKSVSQSDEYQEFNYLFISNKETDKAKLFVTDDVCDDSNITHKGFWCPKTAIIEDTNSSVKIAKWCDIVFRDLILNE